MLINMLPSILLSHMLCEFNWPLNNPFDMSNEHGSYKISRSIESIAWELLHQMYVITTCYDYFSVSLNNALLLGLMIIQYVRVVLAYLQFGLWWLGLRVASSIILGMNALSCTLA